MAQRAEKARQVSIATGLARWFIAQDFEKVRMNLAMMAVTGLASLFVSSGEPARSRAGSPPGLVNNAHLSGLYERRMR
jgi:hypothetical protein